MTLSAVPALVMAGFAASFAASGLEGSALLPAAPLLLRWLLSIALHTAWLLPDLRRRSPLAASVCWLLCVWLARRGLHSDSTGTAAALLLEGIPLLLLSPPSDWPDRIARWRRAQAAISSQLRLASGFFPWFREASHAFLHGPVRPPAAADDLDALHELDQRAGACEDMLRDLLRELPKSPNGGRS